MFRIIHLIPCGVGLDEASGVFAFYLQQYFEHRKDKIG